MTFVHMLTAIKSCCITLLLTKTISHDSTPTGYHGGGVYGFTYKYKLVCVRACRTLVIKKTPHYQLAQAMINNEDFDNENDLNSQHAEENSQVPQEDMADEEQQKKGGTIII